MFTQIITATTPNGLVLEKRTIKAPSRFSREFNEQANKAWAELKSRHGDCYLFTESFDHA